MADVRDFLMPDLGEGLTEGEILQWLVAAGDVVAVDQPIAEIATEKAVVEVPTPFAGRVAKLHGTPGDMVAVGRPLISIEVSAGTSESASGNVLVGYGTNDTPTRRRRLIASDAVSAAEPAHSSPSAVPPSSPLVRRLAAELGVDLSSITGTGPGGMVTRADLERAGTPAPAASGGRIRLTGVHRVAAERLTRSHREAPTASAWLTVNATRLVELRDQLNARQDDTHVTPFVVILRLCVLALQRFPRLNAHFDTGAGEIVPFETIHLGVAVQTDRGLVVPVIRDAQHKPLLSLAAELERLASGARKGSLEASELTGSTFTVSNFGAFGVDGGTAIINPPEAAILGVGQIAARPWVVDGQVVPRTLVQLSLVFDHRVADGGLAGGFLKHVGSLIEAPDVATTDD
jgi:2-oxoisovalerate dehydrogenase E2 component (dihydrolipoyl transacylase)